MALEAPLLVGVLVQPAQPLAQVCVSQEMSLIQLFLVTSPKVTWTASSGKMVAIAATGLLILGNSVFILGSEQISGKDLFQWSSLPGSAQHLWGLSCTRSVALAALTACH